MDCVDSSTIIEICDEALAGRGSSDMVVDRLIRAITRNRAANWDLVLQCREPLVSDAQLGRLKSRIDGLNGHRIQLIGKIEELSRAQLDTDKPSPRPHTESWGTLIGRIVIAAVRRHKVGYDNARVEAAQADLDVLVRANDTLLAKVRLGRATFPILRSSKSYGRQEVQ